MFSIQGAVSHPTSPACDRHQERLEGLAVRLRSQLRLLDRRFGAGELSPSDYLRRYALPHRRLYNILAEKDRYARLQAQLRWAQGGAALWLA
jgi:hypothetical protein